MRFKSKYALSAIFIIASVFFSYFERAEASPFVSFGYGRGGTDLSDLTGNQKYHIPAGAGFFMSLGSILPISETKPHQFEAQLGVGYMFQDDADDKNKNTVSWSHIPIDAIYFYHNTRDRFRIGYGVSYQVENILKGDGSRATSKIRADNALGWVITVEKYFSQADHVSIGGVGLRYNIIEYSSSKFQRDANGNALFLTFTLTAAQ